MFCALLTSRYQVSVYRTNGPLVDISHDNTCCLATRECKVNDLGHTEKLSLKMKSRAIRASILCQKSFHLKLQLPL